jgi:hypothetical protein
MERVRIPPQRIKIVAAATLPEQAPLKTPQISWPASWPMRFEQFLG